MSSTRARELHAAPARAIFASNLPEAIVGAQKMRDAGMQRGHVLLIWGATAILLAVAVVVGYGAVEGVDEETLAWPLGFAAGAVLASLADTLTPEAYKEGGPLVAFATALGFLLSFLVSSHTHEKFEREARPSISTSGGRVQQCP